MAGIRPRAGGSVRGEEGLPRQRVPADMSVSILGGSGLTNGLPASGTPPLVMLATPGALDEWATVASTAGVRRTRVSLG
jgi:hypothetical protein